MGYRRVTPEDRLLIKAFLEEGFNQSAIAVKLKLDKSTISREISRNRGRRGYRFQQAQRFADERQVWRKELRIWTPGLLRAVRERLFRKWSPEQIAARLELEGDFQISAESIYQMIRQDRESGGDLWRNLRRSHKQRRRRFPSGNRQGVIRNATPISERPKKIGKRKKVGHWERDTMIGKNRKTAVLALVDRKSRYNKFKKLNRRKRAIGPTPFLI